MSSSTHGFAPDVDQIFDALDCHILREYLILLFYD
ncbi:hypothetical protein ACNAH7_001443 [Escherichia coli]